MMRAVNALDESGFIALLGSVFEHAPWVAKAAWTHRPFQSVSDLHAAMAVVVAEAAPERQLALLRAHPELSSPGVLSAASTREQATLGLDRLANAEAARFTELNRDYRARFGFPFIIAVRGQRDRAAILAAMQARFANDAAMERRVALAEVARIARFRLDDLIGEDSDR